MGYGNTADDAGEDAACGNPSDCEAVSDGEDPTVPEGHRGSDYCH